MKIAVHCRCAVARTIDTDKVGPYRLRCTTCREVIYDPAQVATVVEPEPDPDEESSFQQWLEGSAELKVMLSSEGDPSPQSCPKHPQRRVVAACNKCSRLLCRACLDRVGETFTCSACVAETVTGKKQKKGKGFLSFLSRLFGGK
jgi:hypothetical protein